MDGGRGEAQPVLTELAAGARAEASAEDSRLRAEAKCLQSTAEEEKRKRE